MCGKDSAPEFNSRLPHFLGGKCVALGKLVNLPEPQILCM
jgi:hypothetical protein